MIVNNDQSIDTLTLRFMNAADSWLQQLRSGYSGCCTEPIDEARNNLWKERFRQNKNIVDPASTVTIQPILVKNDVPNLKMISGKDLGTDGATYNNPDYLGVNFVVWYVNGSRPLGESEGLQILPTGGFKFDPAKFVLQQGEQLIIFK